MVEAAGELHLPCGVSSRSPQHQRGPPGTGGQTWQAGNPLFLWRSMGNCPLPCLLKGSSQMWGFLGEVWQISLNLGIEAREIEN